MALPQSDLTEFLFAQLVFPTQLGLEGLDGRRKVLRRKLSPLACKFKS